MAKCAILNIFRDELPATFGSLPEKEAPKMTVKLDVFYPHRHNIDGSFDSICLTCRSTVATSKSEVELVVFEKAHVCDAGSLAARFFSGQAFGIGTRVPGH